MPETTSEGGRTRPEIESMRWYHTLELPNGVVTPGEFDLRPIIDRLPIPASLEGKRCIDIGGRDGYYAFEMERRGSDDVLSTDIDDPSDLDLPADAQAGTDAISAELRDGHRAFETARAALGSKVRREMVSIYELDPEVQGEFDFGVIGSLLLHLRDPVGALAAARRVIRGHLLINDAVAFGSDLLRRRPVAELQMQGIPFWWVCNPAGLRRMAEAAGFRVVDSGRPYLLPRGDGNSAPQPRVLGPVTGLPRRLALRRGAPHAWVLVAAT